MVEMEKPDCQSIFQIYEPLEEYHTTCPWVLVAWSGAHTHLIPSPLKTPPIIQHTIFHLLSNLDQDLADITPWQFLRHPNVWSFLKDAFPHRSFPALSDLHISLSNWEHCRSYLEQAKIKVFPEGSGWQGKWVSISLCWVFNWSCHRTITSQRRTRPPTTKGGDLYLYCSRAWLFGVSCAWRGWTKARGWRCSSSCHLHKPRE